MIRGNSQFMRGIALGLSIVALVAIIAALIIGYVNDGEVNFLLISIAALVLSANLLVIKSRRNKSRTTDPAEQIK